MNDILVEVIKECKIGDTPWYELRMNGNLIYGSHNIDKVMNVFDEIKEKKTPVLTREILVSEKI